MLVTPSHLPSDVATDDDVTPEDGAGGDVLVDRVRHDAGIHGELDGGGVDDTDDVARARGRKEAKEWPVGAVLI